MALPKSKPDQVFVKVKALDGGLITLPDHCFIHPVTNKDDKRTVPSLAFLIEHPGSTHLFNHDPSQPFRMMFDLGLRANIEAYLPAQQAHLKNNRVPYRLGPSSIAEKLKKGGVEASDIDAVVLSHVHYDHHGDPVDFPKATFIVGPGALDVLKNGLPGTARKKGTHQAFDPHLLPLDRTRELLNIPISFTRASSGWSWTEIGPFEAAIDMFGDGAVYIVNAPGHLPGHINLLCRTGAGTWMYLAGDSAHDMRLVTGEKEVGTWRDGGGSGGGGGDGSDSDDDDGGSGGERLCIHVDRKLAEATIVKIRELMQANSGGGQGEEEEVELVLAHDEQWFIKNQQRMFPNSL